MEDVDAGKFVTVLTVMSEAHEYDEVTFVFEVNFKEKLPLIDNIIKYCRKHYVEIDCGEILFNPMTSQLFFVLSDSFAIYVNDSSNKKEVLEKYKLYEDEDGEGIDWVDDSNNWAETHIDDVSESFYGDEWGPDIINGFFPIGKLKTIDDYE